MSYTKISRRSFIKSAASCAVSLPFIHGCGNNLTTSSPPNILFFLIDDQRSNTLGCAGHPLLQTPNIDSLAAHGCRFENAFVTTSICAASRASIFTGLHERTHGYTFGTPPIKEQFISQSYPTLLRKNGYKTGFIGKLGVEIEPESLENMFHFFRPLDRSPYFHQVDDGSIRHETDHATDLAIDFLQDATADSPFSLSVSFNAPHAEDDDLESHYPSPTSAKGYYEKDYIPPPQLSDPSIFQALPGFLKSSLNRERYFWRWDTQEKYQKNMRSYFRMITGIDLAIGRIQAELKRKNLDRNTIIIYMSDNGYYMGERGLAGKWSHFEQSLKIPLIIYDPRTPVAHRGMVEDALALNIDIPSYILDIANIEVPKQYQGRSLSPLIVGKMNQNWRDDFFCEHLMEHEKIPKWEGIHGERYVYARYFEQQPVYEFLHDLQEDPHQLNNFSQNTNYREVLLQLRNRCDTLKYQYTIAG